MKSIYVNLPKKKEDLLEGILIGAVDNPDGSSAITVYLCYTQKQVADVTFGFRMSDRTDVLASLTSSALPWESPQPMVKITGAAARMILAALYEENEHRDPVQPEVPLASCCRIYGCAPDGSMEEAVCAFYSVNAEGECIVHLLHSLEQYHEARKDPALDRVIHDHSDVLTSLFDFEERSIHAPYRLTGRLAFLFIWGIQHLIDRERFEQAMAETGVNVPAHTPSSRVS